MFNNQNVQGPVIGYNICGASYCGDNHTFPNITFLWKESLRINRENILTEYKCILTLSKLGEQIIDSSETMILFSNDV